MEPFAAFNATLSACTIHGVVFILPKGVFTPTYPNGIEANDDVTDWANVQVWQCDQARLGNTIVDDFRFAFLSSMIMPPQGGDQNVSHFFLHQFYTTSPVFSENASAIFDWDVSLVDAFGIEYINPGASGPKAVTLRVPDGATPDYLVNGAYDIQGKVIGHDTYAYVFQNATQGLFALRLDYDLKNTSSACQIQFGPDSYWASHSAAIVAPTAFLRSTDVAGTGEFIPIV